MQTLFPERLLLKGAQMQAATDFQLLGISIDFHSLSLKIELSCIF